MNLSERLIHIIKLIPKCNCLADIGTDHGFIPMYSIINNIATHAIASDINKGPIRIAEINIDKYNLSGKIQTRIGPGLSILRRFLVETGFNIVDEDIVKDENKYYHIIKAENKSSQKYINEAYYYTGTKLIEKGNPLIKEYIIYKIKSFNNILNNISPIEQSSRYEELVSLKKDFEEILGCL